MRKLMSAIFVSLVTATAWAGAPLKGIDVKLGKSPGGSPAARTTNAEGKIDFGVLPAGSYFIVVGDAKDLHEQYVELEIRGPKEGTLKKRWNFAQKKAFGLDPVVREAGVDTIVFTSDGKHPIEIAATTVRSKSNIRNN